MTASAAMNWPALTIAIIGGDAREAEIARLAAATGATVRGFGFPWPAEGIAGVVRAATAAAAMRDAAIALFPIAGIKEGCLYAPTMTVPIAIGDDLLGGMARPAHIFTGAIDPRLRHEAARREITLHAYEHDEESRLLRAPSVVEGVLALLIANTAESLHGARVAVLGQGALGSLLALTLHKLGARVEAIARDPVQRARAQTHGLAAEDFAGLERLAPALDILISAVPRPVVGEALLRRLRPGTLVVDLASPPGSIDLEAARALALKALWGRGLGARAPITVGRAQWSTLRRRIAALSPI
jgi:dipicolinate synthase subunit A